MNTTAGESGVIAMTKHSAPMDELTSLPNIGPVVAGKLKAAGVTMPAQLKTLGSVETLLRIRALAARREEVPCASMLSGLEGAIRGARWHAIPRPERVALWRRYLARCADGGPQRP